MWRSWIDKWRGRATERSAPAAAPQARVVPHEEWSTWLAQGQWDRAAVCLEEWRNRPEKPELAVLMPQWQDWLSNAFLKNAWADLAPPTALRWLRRVDRFADRGLKHPPLEDFRQVADLLWDMQRLEQQGHCRDALTRLEQATLLAHKLNAPLKIETQSIQTRLNQAHDTIMEWSVRMRIYSDDGRHDLARTFAQRIVGLAPEHLGALAVLRVKEKPASIAANDENTVNETVRLDRTPDEPVHETAARQASACDAQTQQAELWQVSLDRAGSWFLTTAGRLEIGPETAPDLAAALGCETQAGTIRLERDEEGCWLIATEGDGLTLNGRPARSGCLMDGAKISLAGGPQLHFCQPRMETGSARLERTGKPSRQGIQGLVMLGNFLQVGGPEAEIPHTELHSPLVIVNHRGQLLARNQQEMADQPIQPPHQMRLASVGIYWELHRLA